MKLLLILGSLLLSTLTFATSYKLDSEYLSSCKGSIQLRGKGSNRYLEVNVKQCSNLVFKNTYGQVIKSYKMQKRGNTYGGNYTLTNEMKSSMAYGSLTVVVTSNSGKTQDTVRVLTVTNSPRTGRNSGGLPYGWEITTARDGYCYLWNAYEQPVKELHSSYCRVYGGSSVMPSEWGYSYTRSNSCAIFDDRTDTFIATVSRSMCR